MLKPAEIIWNTDNPNLFCFIETNGATGFGIKITEEMKNSLKNERVAYLSSADYCARWNLGVPDSNIMAYDLVGLVHSTKGPAFSNLDYPTYFYYGKHYSRDEWFEFLTLEEKREYLWNL